MTRNSRVHILILYNILYSNGIHPLTQIAGYVRLQAKLSVNCVFFNALTNNASASSVIAVVVILIVRLVSKTTPAWLTIWVTTTLVPLPCWRWPSPALPSSTMVKSLGWSMVSCYLMGSTPLTQQWVCILLVCLNINTGWVEVYWWWSKSKVNVSHCKHTKFHVSQNF